MEQRLKTLSVRKTGKTHLWHLWHYFWEVMIGRGIRELLGVGNILFHDVDTNHVGVHFVKIPLTRNLTFVPFWYTSKGCLKKKTTLNQYPLIYHIKIFNWRNIWGKRYLRKGSFNCHKYCHFSSEILQYFSKLFPLGKVTFLKLFFSTHYSKEKFLHTRRHLLSCLNHAHFNSLHDESDLFMCFGMTLLKEPTQVKCLANTLKMIMTP